MKSSIAIKITDLTKKFNSKTAVDNLSLEINEGELFSLLGVNGAGKTTTIRMLSCLTAPTLGDALLLNKSIVKDAQEVKKIINLSPQDTAIAEGLTVEENLEFFSEIYGNSKELTIKKVDNLLDVFGLMELRKSKARTLSGGMKRRLSIAISLVSDPKVLFLDEPTLGLDVLARRELWKIIRKLKENMTIILTTHYMEEAEILSDRVAIMNKGKLIEIDSPKNYLKKYKTKTLEDAFVKIIEGGN